MNRTTVLRRLATSLVLLCAALAVGWQYRIYLLNPWTRDGLVQSQVILMASQINGVVAEVSITDNAVVHSGDLLFALQDGPCLAALHEAEAALTHAEALSQLAAGQAARAEDTARETPGALSSQTFQDAQLNALAAQKNAEAARAALSLARQHFEFTRITAPADGYITRLTLSPGSTVAAYQPVLALIRADSFRIEGFFRETDMLHISVGQSALVTLMSHPGVVLPGVVESIGWGIARANGSTGPASESLLPVVSPTFEWIRLAQRLPVRVRLDPLPPGVTLRMGETASIIINEKNKQKK